MRKSEGIFQKLFGSFSFGGSRVPLKSNIYRGGSGFSQIGRTGRWGRGNRQSPILGNATPSNLISGYYDRIDELRSYQLLDITKLAVNFFVDYIVNFLNDDGQQLVTILKEDGTTDDNKTERLNDILIKDLKLMDYIKEHLKDEVYFGQYSSMIFNSKDDQGHLKFRFEEIYDPVSVITKKKRNLEGGMDETYLAKGENGKIYEIPKNKIFTLGSINLRLINDLDEGFNNSPEKNWKMAEKDDNKDGLKQVLVQSSYLAGEPLFYSLILKVKELIIKEILVSLISLRDLSSVQLFLLQFDKSTPMETASELCARTTKLANTTNELASFLTSQFDIPSFIENTLSQPAKFVPDYNSTIGNKNAMIPLDKLSDKLLDIMQNLDGCRASVLNPLGIPSTIIDSTSGSKWAILQQSERANSKVSSFMSGINESILKLVCSIHSTVYNEEIDPSFIKLHTSEKTSVEYNNQINQSESINGLMTGITGVLTNSLQALEAAYPLIDAESFLNYIRNLIKDIDSDTEPLITDKTVEAYVKYLKLKANAMAEQQGIDPTALEPEPEEKDNLGI